MQAEASSQNFDQTLKGVDGSEGVPGEERPVGFLREGEARRPGWQEHYAASLSRALRPGSLQSPHGRAGVGGRSFIPNTWSTYASSRLLSIVHAHVNPPSSVSRLS